MYFFKGLLNLFMLATTQLVSQKTPYQLPSEIEGMCPNPIFELPKGCENYTVVKWPKAPPRIMLMGETHEICDESRLSCTTSLIQEIFKKQNLQKSDVAILFEGAGYDKQLFCEEHGFGEVSENCYGWNLKNKDYQKLAEPETQLQVYNQTSVVIKKQIVELLKNGPLEQEFISSFITFVRGFIRKLKSDIREYERAKKEKLTGKNHGFLTIFSGKIRIHKLAISIMQTFLREIEDSTSLDSIMTTMDDGNVAQNMEKVLVKYRQFKDMDLITLQNKHLLSSIKEKSEKYPVVFAFAGDYHLNSKESNDPEVLKPLYDGLDEFSEDSYAVLSCQL